VPRLSPTLASSLSSVDPRAFSPRGVVFDLFHTLVDPEDFRPAGFLRAAAVASTLRVAEDRFTSFWSDTAQHRLLGHVSPRESMMEFLAKEGLAREKEFLRLVDEADHLLGRDQEAALLKPRPEVLEALALLRERGLRLGLLSNADKREIRRWRESPLGTVEPASCRAPKKQASPSSSLCAGLWIRTRSIHRSSWTRSSGRLMSRSRRFKN